MRRAGLRPRAGRIISSSVNSVPSNITQSAPASRCRSAGHRGAAGDVVQRARTGAKRHPTASPSSARPGSPPLRQRAAPCPARHRRWPNPRHIEGFIEHDRPARHDVGVQSAEDWIGIEHREARRHAQQREGLAFAQMQQAGDGVDLRPCQQHRGDRRIAEGCRCVGMRVAGVASICWRRSGLAFTSIHRSPPSAETAMLAWVRGGAAGSPLTRPQRSRRRRNSIAEIRRRRGAKHDHPEHQAVAPGCCLSRSRRRRSC